MKFFTLLIVLAASLVATSGRAQSSGSFDLSEAPSVGAPIAFAPTYPPQPTRMRNKSVFYVGVVMASVGTTAGVFGLTEISANSPRCRNAYRCQFMGLEAFLDVFPYLVVASAGGVLTLMGGVTMLAGGSQVPDEHRAPNAVTLRPRVDVGVGSARATWRF